MMADMKTRIEAARLLIWNAALAKERSKHGSGRYTLEASMAKLFASETAMWVTEKAVQIHGGMGYSKELPLERYFRVRRSPRSTKGRARFNGWSSRAMYWG
jgi:alkylation response protein AidB-like acyl-CoA dehydrogenase